MELVFHTVSHLKRRIKGVVVAALYYSRLLPLYLKVILHRRAVVLTYHRVLPNDVQPASYSSEAILVTPETFDLHMRIVKRFLRPVSGEEFEAMIVGSQPFPPGTCLVTFDDGWYDNLVFALPILERHRVPAVLFVATDFIGSDKCFWQERLAHMLHVASRDGEVAHKVFDLVGATPIVRLPHTRVRAAIRRLINELKARPYRDVEELVAKVAAITPTRENEPGSTSVDRFMTWDDVGRLQRSGLVTVASHTMSHTPLTKQDEHAARRELMLSRSEIERRVGSRSRLFAYPNGDCDNRAATWVRDSGYTVAFSTAHGHVSRAANPFRMKRVNIHERTTATTAAFLARIAGL